MFTTEAVVFSKRYPKGCFLNSKSYVFYMILTETDKSGHNQYQSSENP